MTAILIHRTDHTEELFVGEHALRYASLWAINQLLGQYVTREQEPYQFGHLTSSETFHECLNQMRKQGLVHPRDPLVLQQMLSARTKSNPFEVVSLLARHWDLTVTQLQNVQVHLHVLLARGAGLRSLVGGSITFTHLDREGLLQDAHPELYRLLTEDQPDATGLGDVVRWKHLIDQGEFEAAHQHFLHSSISAHLAVELEEFREELHSQSSRRQHQNQALTPPVRKYAPNVFTLGHALLHEDEGHLQEASEKEQQQAREAVDLHRRYRKLRQQLDEAWEQQDRTRSRALEEEAHQVVLQLTRNHLLPALVGIDPAIDQLFHQHSGDHLLDVLPTLKFEGGDHGGWHALSFTHKGVMVTLTDSDPSYPHLEDVGIQLSFEDRDATYSMAVYDQQVVLDATRELHLLEAHG